MASVRPEAFSEAGAQVHVVHMSRAPATAANLIAAISLRRLIKRLAPDLVHGHSSVGGALARVASLRLRPCVYTPHALGRSRGARVIERTLAAATRAIIAVSQSEAEELKAAGVRARIVVVANGVDLQPARPPTPASDLRAALGIPPESTVVGTVSRLSHQKAPEVFVRAMARLVPSWPLAHFVLIGGGTPDAPLREALRTEALRGRIHLVQDLPASASDVTAQFDVFVLASRFEGGPYAPLDAVRAGVPVVLSDVVGNRDIVVDGVSGLLFPVGDDRALAEAVERLLANRDFGGSLAAAATARLAELFDVRRQAAETLALYRDVTG
jgi:glycosyltransferase involved in cell wall biosynthesis